MRNKLLTAAGFALAAALTTSGARADDIDIYTTGGGGNSADEPMVMFSIDWRPNLSATVCNGSECDALYAEGFLDKNPATETVVAFDLYRAVLKKVFAGISGVKVGLMVNHDNKGNCSGPQSGNSTCTNGGFIASGFRSLQPNDANGAKQAFLDKLASMPLPQGDQSHKYQASELFFEFYRYLTGGDVYNGHNGYGSFDGNSGDSSMNVDEEYTDFSWDETIETAGGKRYASPLSSTGANACGPSLYTINLMFGTLNDDSESDDAIEAARSDGGMGINLPGNNNNRFETILSFLRDTDLSPTLPGQQNVTSYFLVPAANNTENKFARLGGSNAALELSNDPEALYDTLKELFTQILSISTTFVSASVPVNVYNRAEVLDEVFLALFQPTEDTAWPGNAKKLRLNTDDVANVFLVDADGDPAIAVDGRIKFDALTFWTDAATLPYPDPNVTGIEADSLVDDKDGRFVPRGGAGQRIAGVAGGDPGMENADAGARQLFTESDSGTALRALDANDDTAADLQDALGAGKRNEALCLLRYARGYDVTSLKSCTSPSPRGWLMGEVLHSRPLALNYGGDPSNPDIRVLLGSNDGFMRMIRNTDGATESGEEVWAFMPRALLATLQQQVNYSAGNGHIYGVDGETSAYVVDVNGDGNIDAAAGDKAWVFFGLRRGGKAYYALDVSDPDTPALLWSIDPSDSDFAELGLSFSQPGVATLDWGSGARPALIFGGGYDIDKDAGSADDDEGNALFIVDAETGDLVWKAVNSDGSPVSEFAAPQLRDGIASAVTMLDSNGDDLVDRVYVGDTGGVVWRADLPGSDRDDWSMHPILSVGRHAGSDDRRFFHAPDVALSRDESAAFDAVVVGSGDRASPLDTVVVNEFYMVKDRNTGIFNVNAVDDDGNPLAAPTLYDRTDLADLTDNCLQDEDQVCAAAIDLTKGWRLTLEGSGEKSLSTPLTLAGAVYFTTYLPAVAASASQCGPAEGKGLLYTVNLHNASAVVNRDVSNDNDGGGQLQKEDRLEALYSGGIPSHVVVLTLADLPPDTVPILRPDLNVEYANSKLNWKTFWHHKQE